MNGQRREFMEYGLFAGVIIFAFNDLERSTRSRDFQTAKHFLTDTSGPWARARRLYCQHLPLDSGAVQREASHRLEIRFRK